MNMPVVPPFAWSKLTQKAKVVTLRTLLLYAEPAIEDHCVEFGHSTH